MDGVDRATALQERLEQFRQSRPTRPITRVHDWCISCGERIEPQRLRAVPDASRCVECETDFVKYEAQYGR